mmetsp:Transcript_20988/g.70002  ORF Transcript_20988/g.70002 Transcript_20988/m.70002 type:complete len:234 (+) Transcript_20988:2409-3110(+)
MVDSVLLRIFDTAILQHILQPRSSKPGCTHSSHVPRDTLSFLDSIKVGPSVPGALDRDINLMLGKLLLQILKGEGDILAALALDCQRVVVGVDDGNGVVMPHEPQLVGGEVGLHDVVLRYLSVARGRVVQYQPLVSDGIHRVWIRLLLLHVLSWGQGANPHGLQELEREACPEVLLEDVPVRIDGLAGGQEDFACSSWVTFDELGDVIHSVLVSHPDASCLSADMLSNFGFGV